MRRAIFLAVVLFLSAMRAEAQCKKCYAPPSGQLYCDQTTYNAFANCQQSPNQNGCEMWGACSGISGSECGTHHCIPQKWTSADDLPETAPFVVASVRIERPQPAPAGTARNRS